MTLAKNLGTVLVVLGLGLAFSTTVEAQPRAKQTAEAHYEKGMKAYTLGHFADAIEEFEKAYELRSEPIFLYNIAQSHRQSDNLPRAVFFYRRYLEAEPKAKNRPEIEKRIKDMEAQIAAQREKEAAGAPANTAPPPAVTPSPATPPAYAAPAPQPVQPYRPAPAAPPSPNAGGGLRLAGIVTGGVGLAAVATGIFFEIHAQSLHDEAYGSNGYDDDKRKSSESYRTLGWVTLGVGGAAVATGAVLYYLGATARPAAALTLVPVIGPGTGGAGFSGRF